MTTLTQLLVFGAAAPVSRLLFRERARHWLMLVGSVLAIYWLQPLTPIRYLDFWLPTATLALTAWVWAATRQPASQPPAPSAAPPASPAAPQAAPGAEARANLVTGIVVSLLVLLVGLLRYLGPVCCVTPARPPDVLSVIAGLGLAVSVTALLLRARPGPALLMAAVLGLVALLLVLKTEPLGQAASAGLRLAAGQSPGLASAADLRWLGFSYVAFRLIHTLRDRAAGRLPGVSLREFISYAVFFPAYTAGPIDRLERFVRDYRQPFSLPAPEVLAGGQRLAMGVFKKFVLADSLALIALNAANASQVQSAGWAWLLLYAYGWRLYLDFSGYTDIAIGLGRLVGIKLPENFDRPYLRQNLTMFWNSWHMTLAHWFRAYVFNPLTRALRARPLPPAVIIYVAQITTMGLIGLWHGVTWTFAIWGLWHGLGLFIHNRWADFAKSRLGWLDSRPRLRRAAHTAGVLLTFHYVTLGWVWFALPDVRLALATFGKLLGYG
jgi:alginate O-acetyltransferase complex protein AlgI